MTISDAAQAALARTLTQAAVLADDLGRLDTVTLAEAAVGLRQIYSEDLTDSLWLADDAALVAALSAVRALLSQRFATDPS